MLVLALLASLGMPAGAQNTDNNGRMFKDSATVDVGANRTFSSMNRLHPFLPFIMRNLTRELQRIFPILFLDRDWD